MWSNSAGSRQIPTECQPQVSCPLPWWNRGELGAGFCHFPAVPHPPLSLLREEPAPQSAGAVLAAGDKSHLLPLVSPERISAPAPAPGDTPWAPPRGGCARTEGPHLPPGAPRGPHRHPEPLGSDLGTSALVVSPVARLHSLPLHSLCQGRAFRRSKESLNAFLWRSVRRARKFQGRALPGMALSSQQSAWKNIPFVKCPWSQQTLRPAVTSQR